MKADGAVWIVGWCALMARAADYRRKAQVSEPVWRAVYLDEARRCVRVAATRREQARSY